MTAVNELEPWKQYLTIIFLEIEVNGKYSSKKPLFTKIEKSNYFSIYTRSYLYKIRKETIKKCDLTDGSNQAGKICMSEAYIGSWHTTCMRES